MSRTGVICLLLALIATDRAAAARPNTARIGAGVMAYEWMRASAIRHHDERAYARFASPDLTVVNADGTLLGRDQHLAEVRTGAALRPADQADERLNLRVFGDLAIVSGRSSWRHSDNTLAQEYFLRVWERSGADWQLVAVQHTTVPRKAVRNSPLRAPAMALDPAEPVAVRTVDSGRASAKEILDALHEQHRLYWKKDIPTYSRFISDDLLRVAEQGIRSKADLISTMLDKLYRPMTPQVDERVHVAGNAATVVWRDAGVADDGKPTQSWFTMVFVKRNNQWQIVQMHSTAIPPERALPAS